MPTAKSLKRLRSASSAFLEDGGSLLHGVDGLLLDIQQTLVDLQRREEILVERELALETREVCLNEMLEKLADRILSIAPIASIVPFPVPELEPKQSPLTLPEVASPTSESKVAKELAEIQSSVTEIVSPTNTPEPAKPVVTTNSAQRFSNHRKHRRR